MATCLPLEFKAQRKEQCFEIAELERSAPLKHLCKSAF